MKINKTELNTREEMKNVKGFRKVLKSMMVKEKLVMEIFVNWKMQKKVY